MSNAEIAIQIKSLRAQLDVLAAKLQSVDSTRGHTFADLNGILAAQSQSAADEIDRVIYRTPPADDHLSPS